jgi:hypothetical protein
MLGIAQLRFGDEAGRSQQVDERTLGRRSPDHIHHSAFTTGTMLTLREIVNNPQSA